MTVTSDPFVNTWLSRNNGLDQNSDGDDHASLLDIDPRFEQGINLICRQGAGD